MRGVSTRTSRENTARWGAGLSARLFRKRVGAVVVHGTLVSGGVWCVVWPTWKRTNRCHVRWPLPVSPRGSTPPLPPATFTSNSLGWAAGRDCTNTRMLSGATGLLAGRLCAAGPLAHPLGHWRHQGVSGLSKGAVTGRGRRKGGLGGRRGWCRSCLDAVCEGGSEAT